MTNPNLAYVALVIDRSGSMQGMRSVVVDGVNKFLAAQRKLAGECRVTVVFFGDSVDPVLTDAPLAEVRDIGLADYRPCGGTPLYDAMCQTIDYLGARLALLPEPHRPGLVTVLTVTDGEENTSKCTSQDVAWRIKEQRDRYGWVFQFIGADQAAILEAIRWGISPANAAQYDASSSLSNASVFRSASASVTRGRHSAACGQSASQAAVVMSYTSAEVQAMAQPEAEPAPEVQP